MKIRLILTGRSYHNAATLPDELELSEGATLQQAIDRVNELLPAEASLTPSCLIALSGQHVGAISNFEDRQLADGQELTFIAPVAGG